MYRKGICYLRTGPVTCIAQSPVCKVHPLELYNLRICSQYVMLLLVFNHNNLIMLVLTASFVDCCSTCICIVLLLGKVYHMVFKILLS